MIRMEKSIRHKWVKHVCKGFELRTGFHPQFAFFLLSLLAIMWCLFAGLFRSSWCFEKAALFCCFTLCAFYIII